MSRYNNREQYFLELAETSRKYYTKYLSKQHNFGAGSAILEIGCGEGGNLLPFGEMGLTTCGIDIAPNKITNARKFFEDRGLPHDFLCTDIISEDVPRLKNSFDIIMVHDVIEHISPSVKSRFVHNLSYYLKPGGIIFFAFPAWMMPFGGHQQICKSKMCSKTPWMHLLPRSLYTKWLELGHEDPAQIKELLSIKECKMTIESFKKLIKNEYEIVDNRCWLVNPHYEAKFGMRPRHLWRPIAAIPWLRNFFSTSTWFILSKREEC